MAKIDDFIKLLKSETIEEWGMHWHVITEPEREEYHVLQVDDGRLYIQQDYNEPSMEVHALLIIEMIGDVIPDIIAMYERAAASDSGDGA
jgi:hypothetical protein